MPFDSIQFAIFLPIVFILYWFVTGRTSRLQNTLLLVSSYFFYASWDYRFLFLLVFSTALDYYTGLKISAAEEPNTKKVWFWISVCVNLGFLGIFKYYNFFITSFAKGFSLLGLHADPWTLKVILPVGVSFYTFHGLSYVIDIYKGRIQPAKTFVEYAVFVSFFPLLVAGPIERATHLLPQIQKQRAFDYAKAIDGLRQILWGCFKKIVIADACCADVVNQIFTNSTSTGYSGSTFVMAAVLFSFQIYCDFSGYSDIALGTARLFGIDLLRNFAFPYFSRDIAEFWRRWHISLSSWFRDYVYIPLGGSRGGTWMKVRNTFIIFLLSGFWHGANWTFLVWGALHAIYFLPLLLLHKNRSNIETVAPGRMLPTPKELLSVCVTFALVSFAWICFRANDMTHAMDIVSKVFSPSLLSRPDAILRWRYLLIAFLLLVEWLGREGQYAIARLGFNWPKPLRWAFYYALISAIAYFAGNGQQFIYFQF